MIHRIAISAALTFVLFGVYAEDAPPGVGVPVHYQLPTDGPLPKTYRVTLAIIDAKNPGWILGQFLSGAPRVVTAENGGRFTDIWDGLDDNFMPLPAGTYGVKGIFMPAEKWKVDGEFHSVVPQFVGGPSSWLPSPDQWEKPEPFGGDPCNQPLSDIDVAADGTAVFYWTYLENGLNQPMFDLKQPVGYAQFQRAFLSGGAGGGTSTCTDGQSVWSFSTDGGPKYVYRADGKPFGTGRANRNNVYRPGGWVHALACYRDAGGESYVYVAQCGRIVELAKKSYVESETERVDKIAILAGADGKSLAEIAVKNPRGIVARNGRLFVLHQATDNSWVVSAAELQSGLPKGELKSLFNVPKNLEPFDLEADSAGRIYLSAPALNKVFQFDESGKPLHTFGRLDTQKPGSYDRESFISPEKLAVWRSPDGQDRLLVVEHGGPNRASEWSADGKLLREFVPPQTRANDGWTVDPEHPEYAYIAGQLDWLTRFKIDYQTGVWTIDAVWPNVGELRRPVFIHRDGRSYLACKLTYSVYRLEGDRWLASAGVLREGKGNGARYFSWHDANGNGQIDADEKTPLEMPGLLLRYHGDNWLSDLSLLALNQSGPDVWRLAPDGFDAHGNPLFKKWERQFTDPVFAARKAGTATALFGGNELAETYSSDWGQSDGSPAEGFYVNARGGKNFSANEGAQVKISSYIPDGKGGYGLRWRTGRAAINGLPRPGEIVGSIHIYKPINKLLSVVDQSRCGILLYTDDGLYVDTLFLDGRKYSHLKYGLYTLPGEFFAGSVFANSQNGKIYFALGKVSPLLFEAQGWSLRENPVRELTQHDQTVTISAAQIASPPELALSVRGGAGVAKLARFAPATGGANLDGSLAGWESCDPLKLRGDAEHSVELRLLYDPEHLYLRWHARLGGKQDFKALQPIERLFSHERLGDTLSFYIQGDPNAPAKASTTGRTGDVRFVCGIFKDGAETKPVVLGMYPSAPAGVKANPTTYRTPVGEANFGHVGLVDGAVTKWLPDADGKGFVLTAALPRAAIPGLPPLSSSVRTMVDAEATLAGHNKFWWSNADGSASKETYDEPTEARLYPSAWAPAQFIGLESGLVVRNWHLCGPFGGPGAEKLTADPNGPMPGSNKDWKQVTKEFCEAGTYPPDERVDLNAKYSGPQITGYWEKLNEVRWKPAQIADLDTRVICGKGGQVYYGATWIYVPVETAMPVEFQGHAQTTLRWWLNGTRVEPGKYIEGKGAVRQIAPSELKLHSGWNEIKFRGYCVGYSPFRVGLVLKAPVDKLWDVRLSAKPE